MSLTIQTSKSGFTTVKGPGFAVFNENRALAIYRANRILKAKRLAVETAANVVPFKARRQA